MAVAQVKIINGQKVLVPVSGSTPVDEVTLNNMQSVTSNAVAKAGSYSTEEHFTGRYLIVGNTKKKVYSKTYLLQGEHTETDLGGNVYGLELGTTPDNLDLLLKLDCVADITGTKYYVPIPRTAYTLAYSTELYVDINNGKIIIYDYQRRRTYWNATATIEYSKTTD